ncbi:MAG: Crp/Fnr family transcriptional regulator [Hyphococcus sp.]
MPDLLTLGDPPLVAFLPQRLVASLEEAATRMRYADEMQIHARGDQKPGLSIVHEGAVRFVRITAGGDEVTVSVLGPGHSFGEATLFTGAGRAYDAMAVGATVIDQIPKTRVDRLLEVEPALARIMLAALTQRLYSALGFLDDLRLLSLEQRVAKLIAGMADNAKTPSVVECRQSDLAFTLGVSRVSVGKALSRLQDEGLIALGYGRINVPDCAALRYWIDEATG